MEDTDFILKLLKEGGTLLPSPTLKQTKQMARTNKSICGFLKKMERIRKSAAQSRLQFRGEPIVVRHSGCRFSAPKVLQKARD